MPYAFDAQTFPTIDVPAVWCYQKPPADQAEFAGFVEQQAAGGLILSADTVESVLRLLLGLTRVEGVYDPPSGYDPELQGDWDGSILTFVFTRRIRKVAETRSEKELELEYQVENQGTFRVVIREDGVSIEKTSSYFGEV
jgi:hypothetical protein